MPAPESAATRDLKRFKRRNYKADSQARLLVLRNLAILRAARAQAKAEAAASKR